MKISKEEVKEVYKNNKNVNVKTINGHPLFNIAPHYLVDISKEELNNDLGTVSIKVAKNIYIAIGKVGENIVDITIYENGEHKKEGSKILGIDPQNSNKNRKLEDYNIYSLLLDKNYQY